MTNITEQAEWSPSVYLIDFTTPALGGVPEFNPNGDPTSGWANAQAKQLADRTQYLKDTLENTDIDVGDLTGRVGTVETTITSHIGSRGTAHTNATTTEAGFMSASDKSKVNNLGVVAIQNCTSSYTVVASDLSKIINCTNGTFTVSLTAASTLGSGFNCVIWNTSSIATDAITIDPNASETVDGVATLTLRRGEGVQILCDGGAWQTGSKKAARGYSENLPSTASRPIASAAYSTAIGSSSSGVSAQTITGSGAMSLGGSYASGVDSFASAIGNNTSSYGALGVSTIAIGDRALASGGNSSTVGGRLNIASGTYSTALGGFGNTASGQFSVALGGYCVATQFGKQAFASGQFASAGDAQSGKMVLRVQSTDATIKTLTSDGAGATSATTSMTPPDDSTFIFRGQVVARNITSDADSKCWEIKGAARRGAGANTIALIGTPVIDVIASDGSSWTLTITVSSSTGSVLIRGTGEASKTINWVCTLSTTEVTG